MDKGRGSLGGKSIRKGVHTTIVAYVTVPEDIDRDLFIKRCYATRTVVLRDEYGAFWNRVFVPKGQMENIIFPEISGELGSMVICNRIPKHEYPVIVAVFDLKDIASTITKEYQSRNQKIDRVTGNSIDVIHDSKKASLEVNVNSKEDSKGELNINISNPDTTAKLNVFVKGNVDIIAEDSIRMKFINEFNVSMYDEDDNGISEFSYNKETGFLLRDEWNNEISMSEKSIKIKEKTSEVELEVRDGKINLGKSGNSKEFIVMGETLVKLLKKLLKEIKKITVPTAHGPSGVPINNPSFIQIESTIDTILSKIVKTE